MSAPSRQPSQLRRHGTAAQASQQCGAPVVASAIPQRPSEGRNAGRCAARSYRTPPDGALRQDRARAQRHAARSVCSGAQGWPQRTPITRPERACPARREMEMHCSARTTCGQHCAAAPASGLCSARRASSARRQRPLRAPPAAAKVPRVQRVEARAPCCAPRRRRGQHTNSREGAVVGRGSQVGPRGPSPAVDSRVQLSRPGRRPSRHGPLVFYSGRRPRDP